MRDLELLVGRCSGVLLRSHVIVMSLDLWDECQPNFNTNIDILYIRSYCIPAKTAPSSIADCECLLSRPLLQRFGEDSLKLSRIRGAHEREASVASWPMETSPTKI
jgi:hypothetical protein